MNKKIMVLLTVIAMLSVPFVVSAQTPGGPFNTAFRVQNLSSSTIANCVYVFYDVAGVPKYTSANSTINPGDSLFVYTPNLSGLSAGLYSGVVSCDQDVAAIVNYSDPDSGSAYAGVGNADLAQTLYAPAVYNNYFNYYTNIFVQNASGGSADVGVAFYAPGSSTPAATQFKAGVPANATWTFSQNGLAGLNKNVSYSAVITSTGNAGAFVNIYGGVGTTANNQLYSYNAVKGGSTPAYAPVIMNGYYGYNTSMTIQNLGASTPYTVTYATGQVQTGVLAANSSVALYTPSSGVPSGQSTGATVTSNGQPLVVLVNESNNYNRADSYIGFSGGNTIARAPIVYKSYYNYNTSVTCQNLGGAPTSMTITYANNAAHPTVSSTTVDPGKSYLFYQPTDPNMLSGNTLGGTSATITGAQPIACIVNEDTNTPPFSTQFLDNLYTYSTISR